ncbi:single-stranded DNA-binding protein [Palleniella muris]|uniref:Single-stranded DNA-binding protein n=1 Tax=Palleniella muris TaxID=3038145 RepID=A0AC61QPE7_9BACT|nr:single-stranded DNA-binding protein [Palleniella muris]TGX81840.1 single-stranded DNA-binding protein [Palleniella muris]
MNKVMLIGNVGKEPDVRYYAADQAVAHVRLATTERGYTLPNGTQVPDRTDWHSLTFSKGLAKVVERYVHKGDKLYIEGRIRYSTMEDKRGVRQLVTDILVDNMEMLSPRKSENTGQTQPAAMGQEKDNIEIPF